MQRQFRSDDTTKWGYGFGKGAYDATLGTETASWNGTTRFQAQGSITGTAGQTSFVKPAGWGHAGLCLLHQTQGTGAGKWELAYVDFSGASAVADEALINSYTTGAQIVTLSNGTDGYKNVNVTGTFSAPNWGGTTGGIAAILASGTVTISGSISAKGVTGTTVSSGTGAGGVGGGFRGGYGGYGSNFQSYSGEGEDGVASSTYNRADAGGGGGKAGSSLDRAVGKGGGGGNGTAGDNGEAFETGSIAGVGGEAAGNAALTSLILGGGGGGSARRDTQPVEISGGSSGGGAVFIFAKNIVITGTINLNGGADPGTAWNPGGGGAGGSCLLKCENATLGTTKITANGGNPDSKHGVGLYIYGNGGAGRIHLDYSKSVTGTTSPTLNSTLDTTVRGLSPSMLIMF